MGNMFTHSFNFTNLEVMPLVLEVAVLLSSFMCVCLNGHNCYNSASNVVVHE